MSQIYIGIKGSDGENHQIKFSKNNYSTIQQK